MHCSLQSFNIRSDADPSLEAALMKARGFALRYPVETGDQGLLFTGGVGVGKTHLAVAVLRELVEQRGATGIFCDYRDLLKQVQNSYNPQIAATELEILRPLLDADVLLLDELGAAKTTDWAWDTIAHILNTRYNDKRTTLITTNYPNQPSALMEAQSFSVTDAAVSRSRTKAEIEAAKRDQTLGDRIGDRMHSRLQQMCITVSMQGDDYRQPVHRTSFSISRKTSDQKTDVKADDVMDDFVRRLSSKT